MAYTRRGSHTKNRFWNGRHRFEHWYRDRTVYFITSRVRDRQPAFASDEACGIFWDRFDFYTGKYGFTPFVTSLVFNHYHTVGYLRVGNNLGPMMRGIHGSVAKLVNDLLPCRIRPFWVDAGHQNYWDGCLRSEVQLRRTYRYVCQQSVRHGLARDWREYPHTHVNIGLDGAVRRSVELDALLKGVPYKRYEGTRRAECPWDRRRRVD